MDNLDTERLIVEIHARPSLWDSSSDLYCDRDLKKRGWEELAHIFGGPNLTTAARKELRHEIQKRWKNIRGCYCREMKRQKGIKLGFGTGPRKSEYIYFKQLKFLQNVAGIRDLEEFTAEDPQNEEEQEEKPLKRAIKDEEYEVQINEEALKEEQARCLKMKRFKRRRRTVENIAEPMVEVLTRPVLEKKELHETLEQDEDRMFLLSLLTSLRSVPLEKKMALKINMMSLINEALQDNSSVSSSFGYRGTPHYNAQAGWYQGPAGDEYSTGSDTCAG